MLAVGLCSLHITQPIRDGENGESLEVAIVGVVISQLHKPSNARHSATYAVEGGGSHVNPAGVSESFFFFLM